MTDANKEILIDLAEAGLSYIACPYSHDSEVVMQHRAMAATRLATWFKRRNVTVFSPLTHSKEMAEIAGDDGAPLPRSYEFWQKDDRLFVSLSSSLVILALEGWAESTGVTDEIHTALDNSLPVFLAIPHPRKDGPERYELKRAPYSIDTKKNEVELGDRRFSEPFSYSPEEVAEDAVTLQTLGLD